MLRSKREQVKIEPPSPVKPKEEPAKSSDNKAPPAPPIERVFPERASDEGGGSAAGASTFSSKADSGVVPGSGTPAEVALPSPDSAAVTGPRVCQRPPARFERIANAKPIQTVRAAYPPMALRAGLESDVTLRIEVDPNGKVTKAEIIRGGGAGFDEEALKAVQQSRFEPAQKDGQNVPAVFTYVYHFRLQK